MALSKPVVEVYRDAQEAVQEKEPPDDDTQPSASTTVTTDGVSLDRSSIIASTAPSSNSQSPVEQRREESALADAGEDDQTAHNSQHASEGEHSDAEQTLLNYIDGSEDSSERTVITPSDSSLDLSIDLPKHEKTSLMKMLASFWSERSASGWKSLDYPLGAMEHCWHDSDIILREDEPSSLIALALSHPDYLAELEVKLREKRWRIQETTRTCSGISAKHGKSKARR